MNSPVKICQECKKEITNKQNNKYCSRKCFLIKSRDKNKINPWRQLNHINWQEKLAKDKEK